MKEDKINETAENMEKALDLLVDSGPMLPTHKAQVILVINATSKETAAAELRLLATKLCHNMPDHQLSREGYSIGHHARSSWVACIDV